MTVNDLTALIGVLTALSGVGVAVWAIMSQGRALRRQLCVQTFAEYTRRYQELLVQVPPGVLSAEDRPELLEEHADQLWLLQAYFDLCFEEHYLYSTGYIEEELWNVWQAGMRRAFARPVVHRGWRLLQPDCQYPQGFVEFIETLLPRSEA